MSDFWGRLAGKFFGVPTLDELIHATEAQLRGDRKDNQGGGGEAATPPVTFVSGPVPKRVDAPLAHPLDIPREDLGPCIATPEVYIGWRWWRLGSNENPGSTTLRSVTQDHVIWNGPTLHANQKPTPSNSYGIYSVTHVEEAYAYRQWPGAYGQIEYSGTVVVGERGFRGEIATIRSLFIERHRIMADADGLRHNEWVMWPEPEIVKELEDRYQVTVTIVPEVDSARSGRGKGGLPRSCLLG